MIHIYRNRYNQITSQKWFDESGKFYTQYYKELYCNYTLPYSNSMVIESTLFYDEEQTKKREFFITINAKYHGNRYCFSSTISNQIELIIPYYNDKIHGICSNNEHYLHGELVTKQHYQQYIDKFVKNVCLTINVFEKGIGKLILGYCEGCC